MLIGRIPINAIQDNDIDFKWFSKNYEKYNVKKDIISEEIKEKINDIKFEVFLGTWCGDTKRMLPKFIKILNYANYNINDVSFIALNKQKQGLDKISEDLNITNVPTIIIYKNGKELNRIVENHVVSLENDIKNILTINTYIHSLSE